MPRFRPKIILPQDDKGLAERRTMIRLGVIQPGPHTWSSAVRDPETSAYLFDRIWYGSMKAKNFSANLDAEVKILQAIKKLFSVESKWTKGALCRLGGGKIWHRVQDMNVTCWCIVGALDLVKHKQPSLAYYADSLYNKLNALARKLGFTYLEDFNDHPNVTHAHMMKFLDKAENIIRNEP